jgi:hypothetical protein
VNSRNADGANQRAEPWPTDDHGPAERERRPGPLPNGVNGGDSLTQGPGSYPCRAKPPVALCLESRNQGAPFAPGRPNFREIHDCPGCRQMMRKVLKI